MLVLFKIFLLFIVGHAASGSDAGSSNLGASSMELFRRSWQTYKKVVKADHMEHAAMTSSLSAALRTHLSGKVDICVADVGCGDLGLLAPLYRSLAPTLAAFTGVDLSEPALAMAQQELAELQGALALRWAHEDLLQWSAATSTEAAVGVDGSLTPPPAPASEVRYDVVICAFSVHHLHDMDKQLFLRNVLQHRLKPNGIVLMADVFMKPQETRDGYMQRFGSHVERTWTSLSTEEVGRCVPASAS